MSKSKTKKTMGWVLVDADGYVYATTFEYLRKDCLKIPHEPAVTCQRAALIVTPPKRRKGAR
jgi:hypothetical protein